MLPSSRKFPAALAAVGAILLASACGHPASDSPTSASPPSGVDAASGSEAADEATPAPSTAPSASASASVSTSASASASASASVKASSSTSASARASHGSTTGGGSDGTGSTQTAAAPPAAAPDFPVPVAVGNATQLITVKTSGSYATVTAWAKGSSGWKSVLSASGRVGSNGIVDGATRRQNTSTTPSGTYTITEGFGVEAGGTTMPYTRGELHPLVGRGPRVDVLQLQAHRDRRRLPPHRVRRPRQ